MTVKDTGHAKAAGDEVAVTGYRGPAPGNGSEPFPSVKLARTGDANASGGGTAISGYVHTLIVQRAPREPASWPHQVGVIPSEARSFQHRAEADRLRAAVDGGGTAVLCQVLTGMGGVGKTQLAADYARAAWDEGGLDVLVWVTASGRSSVVSAYAQAGVELCQADPDDPEQAARTFLAWLAPKPGQRPCRWLIVLDDVTDPGDLVVNPDDPGNRYSLWPPASPHGRTLLTTRRRDAALYGQDRRRIEVGLFTPAESAAYLTAALDAQDRTEPAGQLTALAAELGHLPLALAQAAAYLIDSGDTAAAYRDLLADRATRLMDLAPDTLPDEQATALAAAWSLSIDRAEQLDPAGLARPMLKLAALLDPNGIPEAVLTSRPALIYLAQRRTRSNRGRARRWWPGKLLRRPAPAALKDVTVTLRVLHRLCLIDHTPATAHQAVRFHQLVQRATRDTLTPGDLDQLTRTAADALIAAWPDTERDTELAQALRANTTALAAHAEGALFQPDTHPVLYRTGRSLGEAGQAIAARDHYQRLATNRHRLGPDHPDTLTARHEFAWWQGEAGDAAGAVMAFKQLLADRRRVLGDDHHDTLTTQIGLIRFRGESGDAAGAVTAFEQLVDNWQHELDDARRDANCLAYVDDCGGAWGLTALRTEQKIEQGWRDRVRVLHDDSQILTARHELARWQGEAGDAAGAASALAELLTDRQRVLGEDHPQTLATRHELARWQGEAGDAAGAASALAELLTDRQRV
ncbi:tetratricopeptide repeat protein, partial [Streptomyces sp. NPDC018352]|uniref:tetratricopeptide repeat protein n=1 Tax=Streptomyces sp. NPDC018352 TaxID=3157194 RepID=UPI00340F6D44